LCGPGSLGLPGPHIKGRATAGGEVIPNSYPYHNYYYYNWSKVSLCMSLCRWYRMGYTLECYAIEQVFSEEPEVLEKTLVGGVYTALHHEILGRKIRSGQRI
jgi:hypothetical protein